MTGQTGGTKTASNWNGNAQPRVEDSRIYSEPMRGIAVGLVISLLLWSIIALWFI